MAADAAYSPGLMSGTKKGETSLPVKAKIVCHYSVSVMRPALTDSAILGEKMTGDIIPFWYYPCA
ncbi:hypothetical protein EWO68_12945 [Salmonella enterica]|nr:hypothetical protein [Salmonella enterica]EBV5863065.1 hypothetical protein [Salmonella enterica subsp. enterica serovar Bere]ECI0839913.1 hypothetical protein [Salmonella enterica subsp. diarizonae]